MMHLVIRNIRGSMHSIPPVELAIRISKILNRNRDKLKAYQDKNGRVNFNLLVGMTLGTICNFSENPAKSANQMLAIFMPVFTANQLNDYANLMMGINNYLVSILDGSPENIYLLEDNKWVSITQAGFDSVYAIWYAFFGIMKVEFSSDKIKQLKPDLVIDEALDSYQIMRRIMSQAILSVDDITIMQHEFPKYAHKFNELRKLMLIQQITPPATIH